MKKATLAVFASPLLFLGAFFVGTPGAEAQTMCTMQYQPVCAAKQVRCITAPCYPVYQTYGNSCMAGADGAAVIHDGACTGAETGPVVPVQPKPKPPVYYYPPVFYTPPTYLPAVYHYPLQPVWHWWQPWSWSFWRW